MKKLFVFLAALVGLSVISCNKEANITVEPSQLTFSAQGGENVLNVTGGTGITATSGDESWCHVAVAATRITVTVDPNEGEESRNTTVTVSCRGTNVPVPVSQEGLSASTDIPSEVEVPYGGGTVTLGKVTANVEVKVTIPTQVTWIHDPAVAEDGTVTVVADANTGAESREAVINVYPVGEPPPRQTFFRTGRGGARRRAGRAASGHSHRQSGCAAFPGHDGPRRVCHLCTSSGRRRRG